MRPNTNSPVVAVVVGLLSILSYLWLGWQGGVVYLVGFIAGGAGTAVNLYRAGKL